MKTVLVVEDNDDLRELFMEILEEAGYRVLGAEHGERALGVLAAVTEPPALVLLDLMMPVMDGRTFLERLGADARWANLPIVVVSAASDREKALSGARRVVKKPISPESLRSIAAEFCGSPN